VNKNLLDRFDNEMMKIYKRAKFEANYNATRYLQILYENGGLRTAQILINASNVSEGYTALWERGRLDLTVEALIFDNPEYHEFFTDDELDIVKKRLIDYDYKLALKLK
jgi:hypothetical protein